MKRALITGITGQDGAYLAKLLVDKNYQVFGVVRNNESRSYFNLEYLQIQDTVFLEACDLMDLPHVIRILEKVKPDEIYNLAAQSSVGLSFQQPTSTIQYNVNSVLNLLEAIRIVDKSIRIYQASSSEMFGKVVNLPITLDTPMHPLSPYAISKAAGYWSIINFRESFGLFACNGILFNHESFLRKSNFFIKKVIVDSLKVKAGNLNKLVIGNIDVKRDFGYAPKYVEAMWLMLQQERAEDFIICSGKSVSLREIISHVFDQLGIDSEKLEIDQNIYRPTDIEDIYGDNSRAKQILGWNYNDEFKDVLNRIISEEISFHSTHDN